MDILVVFFLSFFSSVVHAQTFGPSSRIHIYSTATRDFTTGEIVDSKDVIGGRFYDIQGQLYGGTLRIGNRFHFEGLVGYHRNAQIFVLDHSHEFALVKRRIGNVSIEPSVQQVTQAEWARSRNDLHILGWMVQPASLGVFVQTRGAKSRSLRAGVTAGPAWVPIESPFAKNNSPVVGRVNLRLSITF